MIFQTDNVSICTSILSNSWYAPLQVCYGMIYGIGAKALAEQLSVNEEEATVFIESFKSRYTGDLKSFWLKDLLYPIYYYVF